MVVTASITLTPAGVETHYSHLLAELYPFPLGRIFSKIRHFEPTLSDEVSLRIAQKFLNDTIVSKRTSLDAP